VKNFILCILNLRIKMLKAFNSLDLTSGRSLTRLVRALFSAKSKRDRVPNIMKHPKFTRDGISKKKPKSYQYDLTQPHITNPERYYDAKEDRKAYRKERNVVKAMKRGLETVGGETGRPLENILKDLTNDELLHDGSSRLIINIHEIEKNHGDKLEDEAVRSVIVNAIKSLTGRVHQKNFREVGIIANFNKKYAVTDKNTWENIVSSLIRFMRKEQNATFEVFGKERTEENFIHTLNSIVQVARYNGVELSNLFNEVERNYLTKMNSFRSIKNFVLFVSSISNDRNMRSKTEFWTAIEKELSSKLDKLNVQDIVSIVYSFSKVKFNSQLVDKLGKK
jgi:hypothetical protein